MIAPRRPYGSGTATSEPLARARRMVATSLLENRPAAPAPVDRVPAWQAWLLVGWMAAITTLYAGRMLGWW